MRYLPMLATTAAVADIPAAWPVEYKWDGMRLLVECHADGVRLFSRNAVDATVRFPEVVAAVTDLPVGTVVDGEVVALDDAGRTSFSRLQERMHLANAVTVARRAPEVPVTLVAFDLLALGGDELLDRPWRERRDLLASVAGRVTVSPVVEGTVATALDAAAANGIEGIVAKDPDSPYRPGERTRSWLKAKVRHRQAFVVGGWIEGSAGAPLGSLLVGYHDDDGALRCAGSVGSGLSADTAAALHATFVQMERDELAFADINLADIAGGKGRWSGATGPPRPAHAVEPTLVVDVEFAEWTPDGRLRHPVFKGARMDKSPSEVTRSG